MTKIPVRLRALNQMVGLSAEAYNLVLEEVGGKERKLPIVIDHFQAQSIALALNKRRAPRPLTHELMVDILEWAGVEAVEVVIRDLKDGVYYADIVLRVGEEERAFDARPSDALALAVRWDLPIYVMEHVLNDAGIDEEDIRSFFEHLERMSQQKGEEQRPQPAGGSTEEFKHLFETKSESELENYFRSLPLKSLSTETLKHLISRAIQKEYYLLAALFQDEINRREGGQAQN